MLVIGKMIHENTTDSDEDNDFHWSEICANWIDLANREDQFDNKEDNHLLEMAQNFHAGIIIFIIYIFKKYTIFAYNFAYLAGRNIHPADDETAKWKLEYLFKEDLRAPTFLGIDS